MKLPACPPDDVGRGLLALWEGQLVLGSDASDFGTERGQIELHGVRLAPAGRVHAKQWPGPDVSAALLEVLDEALGKATDPQQQGAVEQVKTGLRGMPAKLLNEIAIGYARRVSGLDG